MKFTQKIFQILVLVLTLAVIPAGFFWLGASHVEPLFRGEFTQHLGSIEVSYIQMAKFIETSLPRFAWQPLWYLGYPMSLLYTPLVPFFEFVSKTLFGWSFSHGYRVLTAFAYAGGLATLYLFAKTLYKNALAGIFAAIYYATVPSVMAFLFSEVAADRFALDFVEPRRFTILVRWGEGPHIVSLLFLPLAALFYILFLRAGGKWMLICGAVLTALVVLTNSVGAWGLVILALALFFGDLIEQGKWQQSTSRSIIFGLVAYGLAAFWFNPLFLSTFFRESGGSLNFWRDQFPWGWLMILVVLTVYLFISKKLLAKIPGMCASILFFMMMFGLVNTYYGSGSEKLELVPQVLRLTTEVDMAAGLVVGAIIATVGAILLRKNIWAYYIGMLVISIGIVPFATRQILLSQTLPQFTIPAEENGVELNQTVEYEVAKTLGEKVRPGERVLVPGNYAFYLNYFSDLPQLRGALFQSSIHHWPDHIYYQVTNGRDGEISLAWLKAANVGWLVFSGPREIFRDYKVPSDKFDQTLTLTQEKLGDKYYRVPLKNASIAKAVPQSLSKIKTPVNAIDEEPLFEYVAQMETSENLLNLRPQENGVYQIIGTTGTDEMVLVQQAFAPGWKATDSKGRQLQVSKDPLSFILIKPVESGEQNITLKYNTPAQVWLGYLATAATFIILLFIIVRVKKPMFEFALQKKKVEEEEE